jgi:hypothetical protein
MKRISTLESLREHLQWALMLEHSTIPPYLCALYSLRPGSNLPAMAAIRAVVMEEMLHMVLVANVLNAIGGSPDLDHAGVIPSYPEALPHSDGRVILNLQRFSPETLSGFMAIERPEPLKSEPEADHFQTIGQFYDALEEGLRSVVDELGHDKVFSGGLTRQVDPSRWYYGAGGAPVLVQDLASSLAALEEIKHQGEGCDQSIFESDEPFGDRELAHFFRFEQIRLGRAFLSSDSPKSGPTGALLPVDWDAVLPMRANPKLAQYADQPEIQALMRGFNRSYTALLKTLHLAFNGQPALLFNAVPLMYRMKEQALALMQVPCGPGSDETVGPSFEFEP